MARKISRIINVRIILLIVCIVIFILLNSTQESYVQISNMTSTTLITTDIGTENSTTTDSVETPPGPTFPTYQPPDTNDNNGEINPNRTSIPSQILPIIIGSGILILIAILLFQRRKATSSSGYFKTEEGIESSVKRKREKFRTQIITLVEILNEYLETGRYAEGIVYGYHQLDSNMKRILGIQRETHLTPKEFAKSLELPEIVTPLNWIIELFYLARYRISPMRYEDLKDFIEHLKILKELSKSGSEIKIIRTEMVDEENE